MLILGIISIAAGPLGTALLAASVSSAGVLTLKNVETLDFVPVVLKGEYCRASDYQALVTADGGLALSRFPEPCYWDKDKKRRDPSVIEIKRDKDWVPLTLKDWDYDSGLGHPLLIQDPTGDLVLLWKGHLTPDRDPGKVALFCMRQFPDGSWSSVITVTDPEAVGVGDFAAISAAPHRTEILWTDYREKHLKWPGGPLFDGVPKLFARSLEGKELGPVSRITGRGKDFVGALRVASHPAGMLYALWSQNDGAADEGHFISVHLEGSWSKPVRVTDWRPPGSKMHFGTANLVVMPSGEAVIFWRRNEPYSDLRYRTYMQGKLGAIETIAPKSCCGDVDVSSDGTIHLIYMDEIAPLVNGRWEASNHRHTLYYQALRDGVWSGRQEIANNVFWGSAHVAVEGTETVHLFWQELSKDRFLFKHASGTLASASAERTSK